MTARCGQMALKNGTSATFSTRALIKHGQVAAFLGHLRDVLQRAIGVRIVNGLDRPTLDHTAGFDEVVLLSSYRTKVSNVVVATVPVGLNTRWVVDLR